MFYFKNETSRYDYPVAEVSDNLCYSGDSLMLPLNSFNIITRGKKSKKGYIDADENLSMKCFYCGEFSEEFCSDISIDYDHTSCMVIAVFPKKIKTMFIVKFAIVLTARNFICFDIVMANGEHYKKIYTYHAKDSRVMSRKIKKKEWDVLVKETALSDYDDGLEVEVNLDTLEKYKNSQFSFKKL